jgi:hypothetical protein
MSKIEPCYMVFIKPMAQQTISYEYNAAARDSLNTTRFVETKRVFFMQNESAVSFFSI